MNTTLISEESFEAGYGGPLNTASGCVAFELVQAFGGRIYSIAKHITQDDDAAEEILLDTFLEVSPEADGCRNDVKVWLRLVTVAVKDAFSKLHDRGDGRRLLEEAADSHEDVVAREIAVWGDNYQQRYSRERTTRLLEHGLGSLDPMCRAVFVLRDIEEVSVEHIARIVNRSAAAVEVCLLRARLQLREMLTQQMRRES